MGKRRICIICARGGSKGVPRKNVRMIAGHPLIAHTIRHAKDSGVFENVIVSSDDDEILVVAKKYGAEPLRRPAELATDEAGALPAIEHALAEAEKKSGRYDVVVVLQATSPIRLPSDIVVAVNILEKNAANNVLSVNAEPASPYYTLIEKNNTGGYALSKSSDIVRRQDTPKVYEINGSIYVWDRDYLLAHKNPLNDKTEIYPMPKERSVDIDTEFDFKIATFLMEGA